MSACWLKAKESVSPWLTAMSELPAAIQLSIVSTAMDSVLLDLERARMEREDFRQGNAPTSSLHHHGAWQPTTWRSLDELHCGTIEDCMQALHDIRYELNDMEDHVPPALVDNYNQMLFAVNVVLGVESDESSESEDESMSE